MPQLDAIALVESAYVLDGTDRAWAKSLVDAAVLEVGRGSGVGALLWRRGPEGVWIDGPLVESPDYSEAHAHFALDVHRELTPEMLETYFHPVPDVRTTSQNPAGLAHFTELARRSGLAISDAVGLGVGDGDGAGVTIAGFSSSIVTLGRAERLRLSRLASHVGAGLRLRRRYGGLAATTRHSTAILAPDGAVVDASPGVGRDARESLIDAVRRIERARGSLRRTAPDEALSLWTALVSGRYSVVDWVDTDRRRFLVAIENPLPAFDPRALTPREREVAEFAARGRTNPEIAYALGLSIGTVSRALRDATRKLGRATRQDLATLFAGGPLVAATLDDSPRLLTLAAAERREDLWRQLSETERTIVALAIRGASDDEIARSRGRSTRTVANQLHRVYSRLGVSGRADLAALLGPGEGLPR